MRGTFGVLSARISSVKNAVASGLRTGRQNADAMYDDIENSMFPSNKGADAGVLSMSGASSTGGGGGKREALGALKQTWKRFTALENDGDDCEECLLDLLHSIRCVVAQLPHNGWALSPLETNQHWQRSQDSSAVLNCNVGPYRLEECHLAQCAPSTLTLQN